MSWWWGFQQVTGGGCHTQTDRRMDRQTARKPRAASTQLAGAGGFVAAAGSGSQLWGVREALSAAVSNSAASVTAREHQESSGGCRVISLSLEAREEGVQHGMGAGRDRSCPPPPSATPCRLPAESLGVSKIMLFVQDLAPCSVAKVGLKAELLQGEDAKSRGGEERGETRRRGRKWGRGNHC